MTTVMPPICYDCIHFHDDPEATKLTCNAFPKGIPLKILLGKADHRRPIKGDNGLQYQDKATSAHA